MLRPFALFALAILTAIGSSPAVSRAQPGAVIERLPTPAANNRSAGVAISSDGTAIVGYSGDYSTSVAYRWAGATADPLGSLSGYASSEATGVSRDGTVIVGRATNSSSDERAFRWTSTGMAALPLVAGTTGRSAAYGVSDDGAVIVGDAPRPSRYPSACYWAADGIHVLETLDDSLSGVSEARAASADGSVIVGKSATDTIVFGRAFRWEAGVMEDLGSLHGSTGTSIAYGVSPDGKIVVGSSRSQFGPEELAFRWTRESEMVELASRPTASPHHSFAYDLSDDGRTIVGSSFSSTDAVGGDACIWIDGQPKQLWDLLGIDYGLDLPGLGWVAFDRIASCSPDGTILTGVGWHRATPATPEVLAPFRIALPRPNAAPTITSAVAEGSTQIAAADSTFLATFQGQDADDDEELTLDVSGLPSGAIMTPVAGTKGPGTAAAPFLATFEWTPSAADIGLSPNVTISFRDSFGKVASRNFRINVRSNVAPTVAALDPVTLECVNGNHFVELSTVVGDADADPLTVTWKVDGVAKQTQSGVASGATVTFGANYAHGAHAVVVEASDGFAKGSSGATVTVQDTQDPTIVVAGDAELTTDPGKNYASKARLPLPTVHDGSGHPVTLTSNAPSQFPLGESTVVWTLTDGDGNQATASQRVVVVDEEKPTIVPSASILAFCDPGKTYATRKLTPPKVSDNVPGATVATSAGTRFGIGVHRVLWTATDAFGNSSQWVQTVTVVNRKPRANAGKDVTITTSSKRGVRVVLNGGASSDPDKQKLKYAWKAKGVHLAPTNSVKPAGVFPVGKTTTATLTVTDAGGLKHSDTVKVTVKLKSSRPRGSDADRSFAAASQHAEQAFASKRSNSAALSGLAYANAASAYGAAAGEFVGQDEDQPVADVLLSYGELRAVQTVYGHAAANALLSAYAETGDESLLSAYRYAAFGTAYAAADLAER